MGEYETGNRKIKLKRQEQKALSLSIKTDHHLKLQYNDCMTVRKDASLQSDQHCYYSDCSKIYSFQLHMALKSERIVDPVMDPVMWLLFKLSKLYLLYASVHLFTHIIIHLHQHLHFIVFYLSSVRSTNPFTGSKKQRIARVSH